MGSNIASSFTSCLGTFENLLSELENQSLPRNLQDQLSPRAVEDELGRFKVWAGNIAAHKTGRSSLDFRLRDATPLRDRIVGLLRDLECLIREVIPVVTGDRKPRDELSYTSDSSDDDESLNQDQATETSNTELQQAFMDIVDIINCLFKLSIAIRNPSPHDRLVKAAVVDTAFYEEWDIQHVKNKFPGVQDYLATRLGKAISRRRQYLKYREKHRKKLAENLPAQKQVAARLPPQILLEKNIEQSTGYGVTTDDDILTRTEPEPERSVVATTVLTQTTASDFVAANIEADAESDGGQTQTSYATSVGKGGKLSFPPPPKDSLDGRPFECQYCFTIVSVKTSHSWKKHLLRDLQPYVCTFAGCATSDKMFDSRHEFFDHELLAHRKEWYCNANCQEPFKLQTDFENHMRHSHPESFSEHQLPALVDMCQRMPDENAEVQCSLCTENIVSINQLGRHVARHLEELALFALPRNNEEDDDGFGSDKVQASNVSHASTTSILSFDEGSASEDLPSLFETDIYTPGAVSKLLEFTEAENERLPYDFMTPLQERIRILLSEPHDPGIQHILEDVSQGMLEQGFLDLMNSQRNVKDLILMFYLRATKSFQKFIGLQEMNDVAWDGRIDRGGALFTQLIAATLADSFGTFKKTELTNNLSSLAAKLLDRASRTDKEQLRRKERHNIQEKKRDETLLHEDLSAYWGFEGENPSNPERKSRLTSEGGEQEFERQTAIYAILMSELDYAKDLNDSGGLYGPSTIISEETTLAFIEDFFNNFEELKVVHESLLQALKQRIGEQGPWVETISDIFREWIPRAKAQYIHYAEGYYAAEMLLKQLKNNSNAEPKYSWTSIINTWLKYLDIPFKRLRQYIILLEAVRKKTQEEKAEFTELSSAIDDIASFCDEFDGTLKIQGRINQKSVEKEELFRKLIIPPEKRGFELNLDDPNRIIFHHGFLERQENEIWTPLYAVILDSHFILANPSQGHDGQGYTQSETAYEIYELPIPMSLLVLDIDDEDGADISSTQVTSPDGPSNSKKRYPFYLKHLGRPCSNALFASTRSSRDGWCENIMAAKSNFAQHLIEQKAEPFHIKILSDVTFGKDPLQPLKRSMKIPGSPLDVAMKELALQYVPEIKYWERVTCATSFIYHGKRVVAVGTTEGVTMCDTLFPRKWWGLLPLPGVTQLYMIKEHNVLVILASHALWIYNNYAVCDYLNSWGGPFEVPKKAASTQPRGECITGKETVDFFVCGMMKDRILIFYSLKEGLHSTFKVLEIYPSKPKGKLGLSLLGSSKSLNDAANLSVREFDEFYIPAICSGLNLFTSSIAVLTSKGLEVLTLDRKVPTSVPSQGNGDNSDLEHQVSKEQPLGMFRISDESFFCCYKERGVFVNKHGEISNCEQVSAMNLRTIEFQAPALTATVDGQYLLLFHIDFVEIRDLTRGEIVQIIAGENICCLDDGQGGMGKRNVIMVMAHPDVNDRQLVLELVLSEMAKI